MAYDPELAVRVRRIVGTKKDFSEKKMFGGLAFMLGDKMCCGVLEDKLVARIGSDRCEAALKRPHVKPMNFTGRPLKGYVYVGSKAIKDDAALKDWVQQSVDFVSTLVGKKGGSKRIRNTSHRLKEKSKDPRRSR